MFVSFLGLSKGASTVTKGFACSLQCERAKFVFKKKKKKLVPNFLVHRGIGLSRYVGIKIYASNFRVRISVDPYAAA